MKFNKIITLTLIIAAISSILGFTYGQIYYKNKPVPKPQLPIQSISNPVVYSLSGIVSGTLIEKKTIPPTEIGFPPVPGGDYGKFVLEDSGIKTEITYSHDKQLHTQFFHPQQQTVYLDKDSISFSDLQIGSYLKGGVTTIIDSTKNSGSPTIVGHVFTVYKSKKDI